MIQPIDWSATAAWVAVIISVVGTVVGPIATAVLTNRHQLKIRKLELRQNERDKRITSIWNCISGIGSVLACPSVENLSFFGQTFPVAYTILPEKYWPLLDDFLISVSNSRFPHAKEISTEIIHLLSDLLVKESQ